MILTGFVSHTEFLSDRLQLIADAVKRLYEGVHQAACFLEFLEEALLRHTIPLTFHSVDRLRQAINDLLTLITALFKLVRYLLHLFWRN